MTKATAGRGGTGSAVSDTEARAPTARQQARRTATDDKITAAVLGIAREHGLGAVTVDDVSARSGVAKTTIYRRYSDRREMLIAVAKQLALPAGTQHAASREGLTDGIREIQDHLEEVVGLRVIGSLLGSSEEFMQEWRACVIAPVIERFDTYFADGTKSGTFAEGIDVRMLVNMMLGALVMEYTLLGDVPDEFPERMVRTVWPILAGPSARRE